MAEIRENPDIENENRIQVEEKENPPKLYSKTLILVFSILFSTIFGAVLLMSNLRTLKKSSARIQVLIFAIVYMIATGVALQSLNLQPGLAAIANVIGAAILNEYFWNKHIGRDREYEKKSWIKPALISLVIVLLTFFLLAGSM